MFENFLDVHRRLATGLQDVGKSLGTQLTVDEHLHNGIIRGWLHFQSGKRKDEPSLTCGHLKRFASIVGLHVPNFHSRPSASSSAMSVSTLAEALPFIGFLFSRSHFTTSLPF